MRATALALLAAGCGGVTGTFSLELVTAPGSTVLAEVARGRLTLSQPPTVVEATRGADGQLHFELDVAADGPAGRLTFEGFDAGDRRIAIGRSPALPVAAVDADVAIYVSGPDQFAAAPVTLDPPRTAVGAAAYPFGVLIAGGLEAGDVASDRVAIYNAYTHRWQAGVGLPTPRVAPSVGGTSSGYAYVFGGRDAAGADTGTFWRYDTTVAPAGAVQVIDDQPGLARSGAPLALVRTEAFIVGGGASPVVLDGLTRTATAAATLPPLAGAATSVVVPAADGTDALYAVYAGAGTGTGGVVTIGPGGVTDEPGVPAAALRVGHGLAPTADGRVVVVGGASGGVPLASGLVISPATHLVTELPALLATPRTDAAIALAGGVLVVAGGIDAGGAVLADAELFDATTLAPRGVVPLVMARAGAVARPLDTGQVLLVGGVDAGGQPVGTVELFTPAP
ncbi:MAG: hypothetical protein R3B06_06100 [Kofleriaceae bacterium]